jgi:hypothetical protein
MRVSYRRSRQRRVRLAVMSQIAKVMRRIEVD